MAAAPEAPERPQRFVPAVQRESYAGPHHNGIRAVNRLLKQHFSFEDRGAEQLHTPAERGAGTHSGGFEYLAF